MVKLASLADLLKIVIFTSPRMCHGARMSRKSRRGFSTNSRPRSPAAYPIHKDRRPLTSSLSLTAKGCSSGIKAPSRAEASRFSGTVKTLVFLGGRSIIERTSLARAALRHLTAQARTEPRRTRWPRKLAAIRVAAFLEVATLRLRAQPRAAVATTVTAPFIPTNRAPFRSQSGPMLLTGLVPSGEGLHRHAGEARQLECAFLATRA